MVERNQYAGTAGTASVASSVGPPKALGENILADIPRGLSTELKRLEEMFIVDREKLKLITQHFVEELKKGLTDDGGDIPMNVTWSFGYPTGHETGSYITIDMGGTNVRVCNVVLTDGKGGVDLVQEKFVMPEGLKKSNAEKLWDFLADCTAKFLQKHKPGTKEVLPLAFTFSFPLTQPNIRSGILQRWTKDFDVDGVEGEDVVPQLEKAFKKRNVPVRIVAVVNDTTGTLIASAYKDPHMKIGSIFSTGVNAAYMEVCGAIPKIKHCGLPPDLEVAINTEYGAFDNSQKVLPRNPFDCIVDENSSRPGQQLYEKMVAGLYIGEMLRLVLLDLYERNHIFRGQDVSYLRQKNSIDSLFLSTVEENKSDALHDIAFILNSALNIKAIDYELKVTRYLTELIATRSARLYSCGIAAISKKKGLDACHLSDVIAEPYNQNRMRFRSQLTNVGTFAKLAASLNSLGKICWMRLERETVHFTIIPDQGTQVWAVLPAEAIFDESYVLEAAAGAVNLEVPIAALSRALRSAIGDKSAQLRLTRKGNVPLLALTIVSSSLVPGNIPVGSEVDEFGGIDHDQSQSVARASAPRERETVITQEIPVKVLHQSAVEGLHEPRCRDPDVHIILPNLAQLKAISDRFTKLAASSSKSSGGASLASGITGPKLQLSANMHGSLKIGIATDSLRISSVWTGLTNPPLDPRQMQGTDMDQLPSERMRQLGNSDDDDEAGWAKIKHTSSHVSNVVKNAIPRTLLIRCLDWRRKLNMYRYELRLHYDYHDDMEFRQTREEVSSSQPSHRRASSHPQISHGASLSITTSPTENAMRRVHKRKSQRLLDAWSLKSVWSSPVDGKRLIETETGKGDEGEIVAIAFSLPEDMERVHATEGKLQDVEARAVVNFPITQFTTWLDMRDNDEKYLDSPTCSEKDSFSDNGRPSIDEDKVAVAPRRMSLLKSVLGLRLPKHTSSSQPRKLMKKENSVRFSFVSKPKKSGEATRSGSRTSNRILELSEKTIDLGSSRPEETGGSDSSPFIHLRISVDGAIVEDKSGRRRVLQMEQIAHAYAVVSADTSLGSIKSRITSLQFRAETDLEGENPRDAILAYKEILDILSKYPALDTNFRIRSGIYHRLGSVYSSLGAAGESEYYFLKALAIYRRIYGRDQSVIYSLLNDIAKLCEKDGYATEASALYERVLAGRLRVLGHNDPETLNSMQGLASIKANLGDLESALQLLEDAVPAFETVLGLQHESTLVAMSHLSSLYQKLGLNEQSLATSRKMLPHCKNVVGYESPLTRNTIIRYLEEAGNFDFPADVKLILDHYRRSRSAESFRVLQTLGRAYMDSGLNRDACEVFLSLLDETTGAKELDSLEFFDALSALCVALEHLGHFDEAIKNYGQLLQSAHKTPSDHPSRSRMDYARSRVTDLIHRREVLTAERRAWEMFEDGPCTSCQLKTKSLCNTCHIVRFCSVACHEKGRLKHKLSCIPSVTLRESRSVAITPRCPPAVQNDALSMILPADRGSTPPSITASHTVYLDPRNFTTFRMKLSSNVNTLLVFSPEADIRYTIIGNLSESGSDQVSLPASPSMSISAGKKPSNMTPSTLAGHQWLTPAQQESVSITPMEQSAAIYLVVAPGEQMMKSLVEKRVRARSGGGEKEYFEALDVPDSQLIEFAQGLMMNGYMGEAFLYIVGWM
ncbi:hexokinase [Talaromyces pinophilus]|uniref:hexokinase n=1 Tax=Talaromyces pinophilus TaxID=128442 RepID=A0A6V8HG63_TALPI|nr:hexokinase [Talaromyces pinophilus]